MGDVGPTWTRIVISLFSLVIWAVAAINWRSYRKTKESEVLVATVCTVVAATIWTAFWAAEFFLAR